MATARRAVFAVMAAGVLVVATGCASEDATIPATTAQEGTTATETGPTAEFRPATDTTAAVAVDPCALVSDETLSDIFTNGAPEPEGTDYGAGVSECTWDAPDAALAVSLVPEGRFVSDFADQLGVGDSVTSDILGPDAMSFLGTVRIDSALSDDTGATVAFVQDETGAVIAVRSGEDGAPSDLATATSVAEEVAEGL